MAKSRLERMREVTAKPVEQPAIAVPAVIPALLRHRGTVPKEAVAVAASMIGCTPAELQAELDKPKKKPNRNEQAHGMSRGLACESP